MGLSCLSATKVVHLKNGLAALTIVHNQNQLRKETTKNYLRSFNVDYFVFTFVISASSHIRTHANRLRSQRTMFE